jgi:hypothetical protein
MFMCTVSEIIYVYVHGFRNYVCLCALFHKLYMFMCTVSEIIYVYVHGFRNYVCLCALFQKLCMFMYTVSEMMYVYVHGFRNSVSHSLPCRIVANRSRKFRVSSTRNILNGGTFITPSVLYQFTQVLIFEL